MGDWIQMGKIKHREKEASLTVFYLKHLLILSIGIVLMGIVAILGFSYMVNSNMIYAANHAQKSIASAYEQIKSADEISVELIPELCQYAIFDFDGNVKSGTIDSDINAAWNAVQENATSYQGNYYQVIPRDNEYCVLKYKLITQYKSEALRKYLPPPQIMFSVSSVLIILFIVIWAAMRFGHQLKTKLNPIIKTAEQVQKQELDFTVARSNVKEINTILVAMDEMRIALKASLENQWKAEQIRKEQISVLAHDLKTPLTIVRGNAELLYDTTLSDEQKECADYIESSSIQMQDYVKKLIEATTTGSSIQFQLQNTDLSSFLHEIITQGNGLCAVKGIDLELKEEHIAEQQIRIDREYLLRAVVNVLSNAVEYTRIGGIVKVVTYNDAKFLCISICDTGAGFSPDALKHATEQFYMGDSSRTSKSHYGMGLYIANSIVFQHGGKLILDNSQETGGAKVTIKIPC